MFIGLTMKFDYFKEKVNLFVALAPVARLDHTLSPLFKELAKFEKELTYIMLNELGMYDVFPPNFRSEAKSALMCERNVTYCEWVLTLYADLDPTVDNWDRSASFKTHTPSGAGWKNFDQYAQFINSAKFQRYDYGKRGNQQAYGQDEAPEYNLANIQGFPIGLFAGSYDELADLEDVEWLNTQLGENVVFFNVYPLGHMSFIIATDMDYFNVDAINLIDQYATNSLSLTVIPQ